MQCFGVLLVKTDQNWKLQDLYSCKKGKVAGLTYRTWHAEDVKE